MKPSGVRTPFASRHLLSKPIDAKQHEPVALPQQYFRELIQQNQWHQEFRRQQTLKRAVAVIRSKSKTEQLIELWGRAMLTVRKTDGWFEKCEKFFQSPVWNLVSDEAIRKARCKCEYWACTRRATQVHLLEFPEGHLEPDFDWMNRDNILIALCDHHQEMIHGFVMRKVMALDLQVDSAADNRSALRPG
jgi:hypothetical protein